MVSDKNKNILEKQLKTLGQKIRIDILKKLSTSQVPLSYSVLQKEILVSHSNSTNLSFHLKTLKNSDLINSVEEGYSLTVLGRQILKNILSIEQILNIQNKSIMIRTSKYSKEPFNLSKVEDYLVNEGKMEIFQARQIAQEVEERLSKTNIEYLTAPLMREYINGILLENGLEKLRHNLTRLGTPPFEVSKYFGNSSLNPESYIKTLGSEISEQYLLLNLLPNNLADLYLSGEIFLLHLDYWSLRPLSIYLNTSDLLKYITSNTNYNKTIPDSLDFRKSILEFSNALREFKPYFSEDLLLGDFNCLIDIYNEDSGTSQQFFDILFSELLRFNSTYYDEKSHLTINLKSLNNDLFKKLICYMNLEKSHYFPNLMIAYSNYKKSNEYDILPFFNSCIQENIKFYNEKESKMMNSTLNLVNYKPNSNNITNKIILDKILINLHTIALESNQNDDIFFNLVQERVNDVFELFAFKKEFVNKKLHNSKNWNHLITTFFNKENKDWVETSSKAISFFGLNKAIKQHCGIEIDRIEKSEKFALKVLSLINAIIKERNSEENDFYTLNQPHNGAYLHETWINDSSNLNKNTPSYSMDLIRKYTKLSIDKQLILYKKFENLLNGGSIFNFYVKINGVNLIDVIEKVVNSNVAAFSITHT